jgi:hypothetical protein
LTLYAVTFANAKTAAPLFSAFSAATAAYVSAAVTSASMFPLQLPLFQLPLRHCFCFCRRRHATTASVSEAIAGTVVSATAAITDKKG